MTDTPTQATINTSENLKGLYQDQSFPYNEAVPEALLLNPLVATVAGAIEGDAPMLRVPYVHTDPQAGFVKEGQKIADGGGQLDEVRISTGKLATLVTQSNESASFDTASQLIAAGVSRAIITQADNALLNNPKASDQAAQNGPAGLLTVDGINTEATDSVHLVTAVANAKAAIGSHDGTPTAILVNFNTEAVLRNQADANGRPLFDPTKADPLTLHGLPVIINKAMPDNKLFIVSAADIVAAAGEVRLAVSDQAVFAADSIQRRATWRIGFGAVHPNRLAVITIGK